VRVEEALKESEQSDYRQFLDNSPAFIYLKDTGDDTFGSTANAKLCPTKKS